MAMDKYGLALSTICRRFWTERHIFLHLFQGVERYVLDH